MYSSMVKQLEQFMDVLLEQDEIFKKVGKAYRKTLDALMEAGFSREEAMQILAHQGMGVKAS